MSEKGIKSDEEWKKHLTPEQYEVLRNKGTEQAFTEKYHNVKDDGMYYCAGCGSQLFSSDAKFDSGTGWPSFSDPVNMEKIELRPDNSRGITRTEVVCKNCGGHLGHVFDDGPGEDGKRYCINSCILNFKKEEK